MSTDDDRDERMRRLLRRADPAPWLTPLTKDAAHRLTEDIMTRRTSPTNTERRGRRRTWAWTGGAVVAGAAATAIALPLAIGSAAGGVTALRQPAANGPAAMCAVVTADALRESDIAVRAEVTGIEGDTVTLRVTDRFVGDVAGTLTTRQGDGVPIDGAPLVFAAGADYLLSARQGVIATCGLSGEDSPELEALYREAFER